MKVKLLLVSFLFIFQLGFSQTESFIKGTVSSDDFLLQNIDVINKTTKQYTKTDEKGEFLIVAKANDSIFFYSKNFYLKRIKVSKLVLEQNNLNVVIVTKPEELDEVVVEKVEGISLRGSKAYEREKIAQYKTDKFDNTETPQAMRDGTLVNGLNFISLGKKIVDYSQKIKEKKEDLPKIPFAALAKKICKENFFTETLKLEPEEIELFLQFCDVDPKSKTLNNQTNVLTMMDFLIIKNKEFQKEKLDTK